MSVTELHPADVLPRHYLFGIGGEIRTRSTRNGWSDTTHPWICASRGITWQLEAVEGVTDGQVFEVIDDPVTDTHRLVVHNDPGPHTTED